MGLPNGRSSGEYLAGRPAGEQSLTVKNSLGDLVVLRQGLYLVAITGTPRFADPELARIQNEDGSSAALVRGYEKAGAAIVEHIEGAFALAVLDCEKDRALLAVDRIGIQTLCYAVDGDRLTFGDTADGVANERAVRARSAPQLSAQSIFDYLYSHVIAAPATVFEGVFRLPPGYLLRFEAGRASVEPYWQIRYREDDPAPFEELRDEFLRTLRESVRSAVELGNGSGVAARPGSFLSGGTDSSTLAGLLGEVTGAPAQTYSIGFDAQGFDEMEYARIAAKHFKTEHHEYYITPDDLADSIPLVAAAYDQPFGNSSALPAYYCARMARRDGVDLMLGGDGGDELFGGNTRYAKQRVFGYYGNLPGWARSVTDGLMQPEIMGKPPLVRKARSYVQQANVPMPDRLQTYNLLTRLGYAEVLEPEFLARIDTQHPLEQMREEYARCDAGSLINRMLALDLKITLADNDLPKVVKTCELAGLDAAFPFLDDRVVAFSAKLDPEYKLKGLKLRWFFKEALRGFLPDAILTKQKHGFGLPFGVWVGSHPRLRELAFGSIESLAQRGFVRADFVKRLTDEFLSDHATYYGEMVWSLMMLEQWLSAKGTGATIGRTAEAIHG